MKTPRIIITRLCLAFILLYTLNACRQDIRDITPDTTTSRNAAAERAPSYADLALRWAPVHYQDVDVTGSHGLSGKSDYITAINFDNDWIATNNWDNIASHNAAAHAYYSVVETSTHWFITYAFFHPRDWTDLFLILDEHENDLEGLLTVVKKDGSEYGSLQGIVTVAHSDFYSFTPAGSQLQNGQETIDGTLSLEQYNNALHPVTAQEAKGHGLKAHPYYKINGEGIRYLPSATVAGIPAHPDDRQVSYKLVDIFEPNGLWEQRNNTQLFSSPAGAFKSSYGNGNANAPWNWNDGNDGDVATGEIATDPAKLVSIYFSNLGTFDRNYTANKYKGI